MSKTRIGIIICLIILFVLGVLFGYAYIKDRNENTDVIGNDFLTKNDYFKFGTADGNGGLYYIRDNPKNLPYKLFLPQFQVCILIEYRKQL